MRKVESEMIKAIRERRNYRCANTVVDQVEDGYAEVRLYGSRIARISYLNNTIELDDCGYRTVTTKSRLNSLISAFTDFGQGIYQIKHKWFWRDGQKWDGDGLAILRI